MRIKFRTQTIIKEALDNLPSGICYLDSKGVPILVNKQMHRLVFALTNHDIQSISDFDTIMQETSAVLLTDNTVWRFQKKIVGENQDITEITAVDITELYQRKKNLEESNCEQQDILRRLEQAGQNIVSIARNEEILAMKMRIHNELAYALGFTRQYIASGCLEEKKAKYLAEQKQMAKKLLGEINNNDEPHLFSELRQTAEKLGMNIVFDGELPEPAENLVTSAVRESLVNTIRHADGDTVFVKATLDGQKYTVVIKNNGKPARGSITEGGGLSFLRKNIEKNGGTMTIASAPEFILTITLLLPEYQEEHS